MIGWVKNKLGIKTGEVDQEEFTAMVKNNKAVVIDVRMPAEYRSEHINPCHNINISEKSFTERLRNFDRDDTYVLYCRSGMRSRKARKKMLKMGFQDVYSLKGGIQQWIGIKKLK